MRICKLALVCLSCCVMLSGCAKTQQVEDQAYAVIMGVDKTDSGEMEICVKIPQISGGTGEGGNSGGNSDYFQVSARGSNYEQALERLNWAVPRNLNFSQLKAVVFSETLARSSYFPDVVKAVIQTERLFSAAHVVVCQGNAGEFVTAMKPAMGARLSADITSMFDHYYSHGFIPNCTLADLYYRGMSFYSEPMAIYAMLRKEPEAQQGQPAMALSGSPDKLASDVKSKIETRYLGAALFSNNTMCGTLDGAQTILTNLIRNDVESFQYEFGGKSIEFVPERRSTLNIDTGSEPVRIRIELQLVAVSQQEMPDGEKLRQAFEEDLRAVIKAAQAYGVDPFGFAEAAVRDFATIDAWRNFNWNEHFQDADIEIDVAFRRSDA